MIENAILEHAKALNNLADAIRGIGQLPLGIAPVAQEEVKKEEPKKTVKKDPEPTGPFYWEDTATEYFGKEDNIKALNKQLATKDTIKQISEDRYNELKAALQERNAKAAAKQKEEAEAKPNKDKTVSELAGELPEASVEDVIACFTKYLPKELDADERKARHAFVKPLLQRFGADKATNLAPQFRALAINLVERKMAGEDIDPETSGYGATEDEDGVI